MKFGGTSVGDTGQAEARRRAPRRRPRGRLEGRRRALRDGQHDRRADPARARSLAAAAPARVRHARLDRRAHLERALRDGDPRSRPRSGLVHRLAGRHRHRRHAHEGEDRRGARAADPRGARAGPDRPRRRVPGRVDSTHDVTTLGRGGSDTTAVALAAALGADACEIFTDVAGSSPPTRASSRRR